jgi:hypothetical protein
LIAALSVVVQSVRVTPALRFFQSQAVPEGCYVIVDCGSSSTKILIETAKGAKTFNEDGDALARIDCVLNWDLNACKDDDDVKNKKAAGTTERMNHLTVDAYKTAILDQINARKGNCAKVYIALFATGGMRQNIAGVVRAYDAQQVKDIAQGFIAFADTKNHALKGAILGSKGAAVKGSVEGFFAIQSAISFHSKLASALGVSATASLAAADLGGQTNQWAWEKKTACN